MKLAERDIDGGALRNPDRRTRNLQGPPAFAECIGGNGIPVLALRMPVPLPQLQHEGQHAVFHEARRHPVVVGDNRGHSRRHSLRHQR
jgi:hypothetical protein